MSRLEKAYTNDEIYQILDNHFEGFVCTGIVKTVGDEGVSNDTFLAHNGNYSCLYGLSAQATISIQKMINDLPWGEDDG